MGPEGGGVVVVLLTASLYCLIAGRQRQSLNTRLTRCCAGTQTGFETAGSRSHFIFDSRGGGCLTIRLRVAYSGPGGPLRNCSLQHH